MTRRTADELWGVDVASLALHDREADAVTPALLADIQVHAAPPAAFRSWALAQPWPRFCAIVRVVSGAVRKETSDGEDE